MSQLSYYLRRRQRERTNDIGPRGNWTREMIADVVIQMHLSDSCVRCIDCSPIMIIDKFNECHVDEMSARSIRTSASHYFELFASLLKFLGLLTRFKVMHCCFINNFVKSYSACIMHWTKIT